MRCQYLGIDLGIYIVAITGEKLEITVPAMTKPDQLLRVRGQGVLDRHGNRGDLVIKLNPRMPEYVSPELTQAIQQEMNKK
jgi:DnaJ-class molecular chaperone